MIECNLNDGDSHQSVEYMRFSGDVCLRLTGLQLQARDCRHTQSLASYTIPGLQVSTGNTRQQWRLAWQSGVVATENEGYELHYTRTVVS